MFANKICCKANRKCYKGNKKSPPTKFIPQRKNICYKGKKGFADENSPN